MGKLKKLVLLVCLVLCVIVVVIARSVEDPSLKCHSSIGNVSLGYLSSKRPYHYQGVLDDNQEHTPEGCKPVKLWYFGRHGTRYPGDEDIEAMLTILPSLHEEILDANMNESVLCKNTLEYFSSWKLRPDVNISVQYHLHEQGKYELSSIASRYVERYPKLFPGEFSNETYYFRATKSQRTEASAKSFVSSIFGEDQLSSVWFPQPIKNDPLIKFYSVCPKWLELVDDKNPEANKEYDAFGMSHVMNATIERVSQRLGLGRNLTLEEITIVYTTCAFETAWMNGRESPWCALFDLEDFKVMAYREDLEYYWNDGYGRDINIQQACPPFQDLIKFFDDKDSRQKVKAYFSHSGAILKMIARLGLFKDKEHLQSDNYNEMKENHKWKTSFIDLMASHMSFVLYKCSNESSKVGFFTQEIPTPLPACGDKAYCSFDRLKETMLEFTNECDLQKICKL